MYDFLENAAHHRFIQAIIRHDIFDIDMILSKPTNEHFLSAQTEYNSSHLQVAVGALFNSPSIEVFETLLRHGLDVNAIPANELSHAIDANLLITICEQRRDLNSEAIQQVLYEAFIKLLATEDYATQPAVINRIATILDNTKHDPSNFVDCLGRSKDLYIISLFHANRERVNANLELVASKHPRLASLTRVTSIEIELHINLTGFQKAQIIVRDGANKAVLFENANYGDQIPRFFKALCNAEPEQAKAIYRDCVTGDASNIKATLSQHGENSVSQDSAAAYEFYMHIGDSDSANTVLNAIVDSESEIVKFFAAHYLAQHPKFSEAVKRILANITPAELMRITIISPANILEVFTQSNLFADDWNAIPSKLSPVNKLGLAQRLVEELPLRADAPALHAYIERRNNMLQRLLPALDLKEFLLSNKPRGKDAEVDYVLQFLQQHILLALACPEFFQSTIDYVDYIKDHEHAAKITEPFLANHYLTLRRLGKVDTASYIVEHIYSQANQYKRSQEQFARFLITKLASESNVHLCANPSLSLEVLQIVAPSILELGKKGAYVPFYFAEMISAFNKVALLHAGTRVEEICAPLFTEGALPEVIMDMGNVTLNQVKAKLTELRTADAPKPFTPGLDAAKAAALVQYKKDLAEWEEAYAEYEKDPLRLPTPLRPDTP